MRRLFVLSYLANVALSVGSLALLPDRVAIHFGARGLPDNWAAKETNALITIALHTVLFAFLYLTPRLVSVLPVGWVNLPHREYWLREDNRLAALERISAYLWQMGAALFVFMLCAGLLALQANLANPVRLDLHLFLGAMAAYLVYTIGWCVAFYRAFRLPKSPGAGAVAP
jgi:hypothetical protein